jgi:radical SAM/Cys-rich protein
MLLNPIAVDQPDPTETAAFVNALRARGIAAPARRRVTTVQVNLGKRCNQACLHCHVEAGPKRTEILDQRTAMRIVELLHAGSGVETLDLTGGAPELNPSFPWLVEAGVAAGLEVIDRCNLTVLFEPGMEGTATFLADNRVRIVASLPCYTPETVDRQRGGGTFEKSIAALRWLNALGYGRDGSGLEIDLVYNPAGASLPPAQAPLEGRYRDELQKLHGIRFNRLLVLANVPIGRFAHDLDRRGELAAYHDLLAANFNPTTIDGLMCRSMVSIDWSGRLHDCDFNQMLEVPLCGEGGGSPRTVWDIESFADVADTPIATAAHCLACTAGSGSSCRGALVAG